MRRRTAALADVSSPTAHSPLSFYGLFKPVLEWTRFALFSKGGIHSCASDVPAELQPYVVHCSEEENAFGREGHTMALFITRHWDHLPRLTLFMQDDETHASPREERLRPLLFSNSEEAFDIWMRTVEAHPFQPATCLCQMTVETFPEGYMAMYRDPIQFFTDSLMGLDSNSWTTLRYPNEAMLVAPSTALRRRDLTLFRVIVELTRGVQIRGTNGTDAPGTLNFLYGALGTLRGVPAGSLMWAHVMERLWLIVMDADYDPNETFGLASHSN